MTAHSASFFHSRRLKLVLNQDQGGFAGIELTAALGLRRLEHAGRFRRRETCMTSESTTFALRFDSTTELRGAADARVRAYWRERYCDAAACPFLVMAEWQNRCTGQDPDRQNPCPNRTTDTRYSYIYKSSLEPRSGIVAQGGGGKEVHKRGELLGGGRAKARDLGRHGHVLPVAVEPVDVELVRGQHRRPLHR